jgi:hypothetical protein
MRRSSPRKSVRRAIAGDAGDDTFVQLRNVADNLAASRGVGAGLATEIVRSAVAVEAVIAARCPDGAGGVEGGIEAGVIAEQPVVPPFAMMSWPAEVLMVPSVRSYRR